MQGRLLVVSRLPQVLHHTRAIHKRIYVPKPYQTLHPEPKEPVYVFPSFPLSFCTIHPLIKVHLSLSSIHYHQLPYNTHYQRTSIYLIYVDSPTIFAILGPLSAHYPPPCASLLCSNPSSFSCFKYPLG